MIRAGIGFLLALLVSILVLPLVERIARVSKAKQPIYHYVEKHSSKQGTPTMGGIGFIFALAISFLFLMSGDKSSALICLIVTVGYGMIGFTDDFLKVHFKKNEKALSPLAKIALQLIIAVLVACYAYFGSEMGSYVYIPFMTERVDLSFFALPYYVFIFLAFTNAVNLTDGLDGLASSVTLTFLIFFSLIMLLVCSFSLSEEQTNVILLLACTAGGLFGFLCFNGFPAKIFMGDTGSLALGGLLAAVSVLTGMSLLAAILGIMYVLSALSVILQVGYFKLTKKRIFLMAPLHHHFERKGVHENRIVAGYVTVTACIGVICTVIYAIFAA